MARIESGKEFDKESNHALVVDNMDNKDTKPYLFNIPSALYKKVRRKMIEDERNLRGILIESLNKYIDE